MAFPFFLNAACMRAFSGRSFERKDDGGDDLLPYNLHQLVYTYPGGFTCTELIGIIVIGDLRGDGVELSSRTRSGPTGLYSKL